MREGPPGPEVEAGAAAGGEEGALIVPTNRQARARWQFAWLGFRKPFAKSASDVFLNEV